MMPARDAPAWRRHFTPIGRACCNHARLSHKRLMAALKPI
jgi:hypothetical protein